MEQALKELKGSLVQIYNCVPDPCDVKHINGYTVVQGTDCERARDRVLLAIDAFLFEFRAYLDLLASFVYGILATLRKGPSEKETLSTGTTIRIINKKGKLSSHAFLLYACDRFSISTEWYEFLCNHRNFFTHEGAPYCAIEPLPLRPPEFDLIVMKANIHDFQNADPSMYFRVSECQQVIKMVRTLSACLQRSVIDQIDK